MRSSFSCQDKSVYNCKPDEEILFPKKCLFFVFFVPKVRKSANNETKMFLSSFRHDFVFVSKRSDVLMGILGTKISSSGLQL